MGHIGYQQWVGAAELAEGTLAGVVMVEGRLTVGVPVETVSYDDPHTGDPRGAFDVGTWTSPRVLPGFAFDELVASWNTVTPAGTWVEIAVVVTDEGGAESKPYLLGRWAMDATTMTRTSVADQDDDLAGVAVDVLTARPGHPLLSYRITVTLCRRHGTDLTPEVSLVGAMVSARPERPALPDRAPRVGSGVVLDVPAFSQELHRGRYAHLSGGGQAWCSPTATSMVLSYFGALPQPDDYAWVDPSYDDPWVVHAASHTYDAAYGAGNWPFNTAYASEMGLRGFVTRLRSLDEIEQFISAGIPLVASVSFAEDALAGAGYSTEGHLMVVVGFTVTGDVIVNDPASHLIASDSAVRTVYARDQFHQAWQAGSDGIVYVIRPAGMALPPSPAEPNW